LELTSTGRSLSKYRKGLIIFFRAGICYGHHGPVLSSREPQELSLKKKSAIVTRRKGAAKKRNIAAFDRDAFLSDIGDGKTVSKYRKGQVIFSQGEIADAVFYIQEGKVKLTVVSKQGKEAVVAILGSGQFFGEGCLNGHPLRIATTRATEECLVTRINKATMIATIQNEPGFSELFMGYLLTRNSRIEEDLIDQLFNSSERRLARLLLLLANFGKEGRPEPILGKFSQETLAEMIGTTRSRVSFFMNKFRKLGFIEYNGKLEVHSSLLSVVLNEKPELKRSDEPMDTD
jgi:CRP/FNR family transcriptional regulator, cyclic AMP receptor protein